jgi:hypothetical protein
LRSESFDIIISVLLKHTFLDGQVLRQWPTKRSYSFLDIFWKRTRAEIDVAELQLGAHSELMDFIAQTSWFQ